VTRLLDDYRLVSDPSALEGAGLFVAEGRLIVERLLEHGGYRIHSVLVTPAAAAALDDAFARRPDVNVLIREPAELEAITGIDFHRGCLALAYRPAPAVLLLEAAGNSRVLAVESVGNPDNIGGLFRTAFALGVDVVLLNETAGDPFYRKAIRTSMGATLRVPFVRATHWLATLASFRDRGFRILALTPHPDATPIDDIRIATDERVVVLVGPEGPGLTAGSLAAISEKVRIPIDARADSLNVVVAAGIALQRLLQT